MRPLQANLSINALKHNLETLRACSPESQHVAVIKANAYGHRVPLLLPELERNPVIDYLAVAIIEEALEIREFGAQKPVLLLEGVFEQEEYYTASEYNFAVVVANAKQLKWLTDVELKKPLNVFLKVDSGMHRLGANPADIPAIYECVSSSKNVKSVTLMTHFACADEADSPLTEKQIAIMEALKEIDAPQSNANSAAVLTLPQTHNAIVRFGISLYGVSPIDDTTGADFNLKPLINLTTKIIHTSIIEKGETVGYGAKFTAPETMPIGVIAMGYADGYPREISTEAYVLVGEHKAPIIGRPAMDMMMIDLRSVPMESWNETVTLFGDALPIERVALWGGTIPYTIFTHLAPRIRFEIVD